MISPRGGSANLAASSSSDPRATSSKRFVSSRHTAAGRPGSSSASTRSDAGRRRGDSNATTAPAHDRSSAAEGAQLSCAPREVPDELKAICDQPAHDERRLDRGGPGEDRHVHVLGHGCRDQSPAGVVHAGKAGVRHERDSLARP